VFGGSDCVQFVQQRFEYGENGRRWMVLEMHQQLNFQKFVDMTCSMIEIITASAM